MSKSTIQPWLEADPKISEWYQSTAKKAKNTALNYSRLLSLYWQSNKRFRSFKNTGQWLTEVNEQQNSPDIIVRRAWGKELQQFFFDYRGKEKKPLASKSQNNLRAAVLHYFKFHIGTPEEFQFTLGTQEQLKEEAIQREDETPPSREDLKAIYSQCRTPRDRALLLTLINGFGLSEWLDFAKSWHRYKKEIEAGTAPLRVEIPFRSKTLRKSKVDSYVFLWEDSVEALKELLGDRERELGRPLVAQDPLFISELGNHLNTNTIELLFRNLATRAGLFKKLGRLQRLRPHKIGRTFFATEAVNAGVDQAVREFVLMHKTDQFGGAYVQFHKTKKGEELIRSQLSKLRAILNLKSDKGTEVEKSSYFDQTVETLAISKGMDPEELRKQLLYYASKLPSIREKVEIRLGKLEHGTGLDIHGSPEDELEDFVRGLEPEELRPAVIAMVKAMSQPTPAQSLDKVIDETELDNYLSTGWTFVSVVNTHKVVVRRATPGDFDQPGASKVGA